MKGPRCVTVRWWTPQLQCRSCQPSWWAVPACHQPPHRPPRRRPRVSPPAAPPAPWRRARAGVPRLPRPTPASKARPWAPPRPPARASGAAALPR
eukprot:366088-Chlamydomonas_euryale.AAC.10